MRTTNGVKIAFGIMGTLIILGVIGALTPGNNTSVGTSAPSTSISIAPTTAVPEAAEYFNWRTHFLAVFSRYGAHNQKLQADAAANAFGPEQQDLAAMGNDAAALENLPPCPDPRLTSDVTNLSIDIQAFTQAGLDILNGNGQLSSAKAAMNRITADEAQLLVDSKHDNSRFL